VSGQQRIERVQALVLRVRPLGERDRLATLFSIERGPFPARATSALELKSRLAARLMPLHLGRFSLVRGTRGLPIVTGAEITRRFAHWRTSAKHLLVSAFLLAILADLNAPPGMNAQFWQLVVNLLCSKPAERELHSLLAICLQRSLELLGLNGDVRCAVCDRSLAPPRYSARSRTFALASDDYTTFFCRRCFNRQYGDRQVEVTKARIGDLAVLPMLRRCPLLDYPKLAFQPRQVAFVVRLFNLRAQDMMPNAVAALQGIAGRLGIPEPSLSTL